MARRDSQARKDRVTAHLTRRKERAAPSWLAPDRADYAALLAGSPDQLETIFDTLTDAVVVYSMDDHILYRNASARAWEERLHVHDDVTGPLLPGLAHNIHDGDGNPLPEHEWPLRRAQRGETLSGELAADVQFHMSDGSDLWVSKSVLPIRDTSGQVTCVLVISRDVTEQHALARRASESAREAEARASQLEAIFDAITDSVQVYDSDGQLLQSNPSAQLINPLMEQPEYRARPLGERITRFDVRDEHGQPLAPEQTPVSRVLRGEVLTGSHAVDTMLRLLDGREIRLNTTGAPVRDAAGVVQGAVIVSREVTERRRLEQRTQETLAALLAMAEALVEEQSANGHVEGNTPPERTVSHRLAALTGSILGCSRVAILAIDPETRLSRPIAVVGLTSEETRQWWDEQQRYPLRVGEELSPDEAARFLDGEIIVADLTQPPFDSMPNPYNIRTVLVAPLRIGDQVVGMLWLDHPGQKHVFTPQELQLAEVVARLAALVVERERLLMERAAVRARVLALEETNRRMNEFLGIAGHEMRTPLTSAKANVQLAARQLRRFLNTLEAVPDGTLNVASLRRLLMLFERTEQQMNRQQRLIDDLLDTSRIQSGKLAMNLRDEDLSTILRDAVEEQRLLFPDRVISLDLPANSPTPIFADPDRIAQVITNFLTNALKYSADNAPVAASLCIDGRTVRVSVRDAGPGLLPEQHARVWEPFHRVPGVEVQTGSGIGLGLGLHISKTIIERHGGRVGIESTRGQGATFWFTLPLISDQPS